MKKKCFALVLAGIIFLLPGCKASQTATTAADQPPAIEQEPPTWQQHTEPVQLTIDSEITAGPDSDAMGDWPLWGEDPVSRHIQNLTGVKLVQRKHFDNLNFDIAPLMASGDWMDLYSSRTAGQNYGLEDSSVCYSLDELAAQYCPEFWDEVDPLEMLNNTASDGHIYTLRGSYYNTDVYDDEDLPIDAPYTLAFNTKWLERAEAQIPTSVEELETVLRQIRDLELGLIPLALTDAITSPIPGWMGILEDTYWDQESRTVRTPLRQEGWVKYLQLMNRWYREGLLVLPTEEYKPNLEWYDTESDDAAFRDRFTDLYSWISSKSALSGAVAYETYSIDNIIPLRKGTKQENFSWQIAEEPLTWENEVRYTAQDNGAWRRSTSVHDVYDGKGLFITKHCSNPERAILFYQFLMSDDGMKLTHWGIEGMHYTLDDHGNPVFMEEYRLNEDVQAVTVPEEEGVGLNYWTYVPSNYYANSFRKNPENIMTNYDSIQLAHQLNEAGLNFKKAAWENKCPVLQFAEPVSGSDDYTAYMAIYHRWLMATEEIITQSTDAADVKDRWNDLLSELRTMGLDNIEQSMTLRFAEALERYHEAGYFTEIQP